MGNVGPGASHDVDVRSRLLEEFRFEIGGEDQLTEIRAKALAETDENKLKGILREASTDVRIRVGTLLKTDTVSFLLGAGASTGCGGVLIGSIPLEVERDLVSEGVRGTRHPRVSTWLRYFYLAAKQVVRSNVVVPTAKGEILLRRQALDGGQAIAIAANYETLLSTLYRWRAAIPEKGGRLRLFDNPNADFRSQEIDECLRRAKRSLARRCRLPSPGKESGLETYKEFIRKILTRPLNLKRVHIFSLNYDTLVEQAADAEGLVLIDGFVGTLRRVFRPECYDQDLYFPAETTEGRVHRHDRVAHLCKLHGSLTWISEPMSMDNPYGLAGTANASDDELVVIYPTPLKYGETLGLPYSEMFRRFAASIVRPQSTLFVVGYGFGDDHVNTIVRQALGVPSFTLVIVDPNPRSEFVETLRAAKDPRVWVFSGKEYGTFAGFVEHALPDLRDEGIRRQIASTQRALNTDRVSFEGDSTNGR
ncbi:MAG: hypothetical protein HPY55_01300 [Firmicutes bacterium]|nr:hypothetical protein [Bacillota bacterium]